MSDDKDFKIHSIALVKNDADVVEDCLIEAARWSDYIYVYDGASTDATWEIVQALSRREPRVVPWKQDPKVFQEWLRAEVFNEFRRQAREGDWWCQLNCDEYYIDEPRAFLARVRRPYHVVWATSVEYFLTPVELKSVDFSLPWPQVRPQLRHYRVFNAEPRFFRHRDRLGWGHAAWPKHLGMVYPELPRFKHYPYRSPQQIQARLDTRRDNRARGFKGWEHASQASWEEKIVPAETCQVDRGDGNYVIDPRVLPNHRGKLSRRLVQRLMHGTGIWP